MNDQKMTKKFFFDLIEEELKRIEERIEEIDPKDESMKNIYFGELMQLKRMNNAAMNIDYWKYSELDEKLSKAIDRI